MASPTIPEHPYHHGNLRPALLDAALALIAELGPRAFTLREVARRAHVSHNAPYRHFASRDDLLAEVARQGFDRLAQSMQASMAFSADPLQRLSLCGQGYVEFALQYPHHLAVMFDRPPQAVASARPPAVPHALQILIDAVDACQAADELPPGDPLSMALTVWSLVHGIARLVSGSVVPMFPLQARAFTAQSCRRLIDGLRQPDPPEER